MKTIQKEGIKYEWLESSEQINLLLFWMLYIFEVYTG